MDIDKFLALETEEIAAIVRDKGPRVVVCPINGTRRWFMLESRKQSQTGDFLGTILARYQEIFELFFSHGISILLTPILGKDIVQRGSAYTRMVFAALEQISTGEAFRQYYEERDIRVRFFGDYEPYLQKNAPEVLQSLADVQTATREHLAHRLLWGMFANDPTEQIAQQAVEFYKSKGQAPNRPEIVTRYYGEYIPPADIFIGMMPPSVFDFPLLETGNTVLYFTHAPTPYIDQAMLRYILHDFMFVRPVDDDYGELDETAWEALDSIYSMHRGDIVGVGRRYGVGRIWLPGIDHRTKNG